MIPNDLFVRLIDYATLKTTMTRDDAIHEANYALEMNFASFCTYPQFMAVVSDVLKGSKVRPSAVIAFPNGNSPCQLKVAEAMYALEEGATELDMVMNLAAFAGRNYDYVQKEIAAVVEVAHAANALVKVIIESCHWNTTNLTMACMMVEQGGADFIKTSTGFAHEGADLFRTQVMCLTLQNRVGVKASGGIKTREQAERFAQMGCTRLGIGSAIKDIMR